MPIAIAWDGYDVSEWNPHVAASGPPLRFLAVKATEGTQHWDKHYVANVNAARQRGTRYLAHYHFLTPDSTGTAQYGNLARALTLVGGLQPHEVVALDWEPDANAGGKTASTHVLADFAMRCTQNGIALRLLYAGASTPGATKAAADAIGCGLWWANYNPDGADVARSIGAVVWQGSSVDGAAAGVTVAPGPIDADLILDPSALDRLFGYAPIPGAPEGGDPMRYLITVAPYANTWLVTDGLVVHVAPEWAAVEAKAGTMTVHCAPHPQTLASLMFHSGTTTAQLV